MNIPRNANKITSREISDSSRIFEKELCFFDLDFNKKFLNDLVNNTSIICSGKRNFLDENLRNNNEKIYEFFKTFVEIWIKDNHITFTNI